MQKSEEKSYEITGVILFLFGLFILFSLFSDSTGFFGDITNKGSHFLFGFGAPFCALLMMFFGGRYAVTSKGISWDRRVALVILLALLLFMAVHHFLVPFGREMDIQSILTYGGIVGAGFCVFFHDAMGYWGTTLVLLGAIVIDVLLLTHWSLSRGAQKVGSKAQVLGKKTGEKIEAAATRLREKKAALDAARSAARLEVLDDKPTEFIYKKNEENAAESPDEELPAEDMAVPAQMPDAEEPPISLEEPQKRIKKHRKSRGRQRSRSRTWKSHRYRRCRKRRMKWQKNRWKNQLKSWPGKRSRRRTFIRYRQRPSQQTRLIPHQSQKRGRCISSLRSRFFTRGRMQDRERPMQDRRRHSSSRRLPASESGRRSFTTAWGRR